MSNLIGVLLIFGLLILFGVSTYLFVKRYKIHKIDRERKAKENEIEFKTEFEQEVIRQKEEDLKKLKSGDSKAIIEIIDRIFKKTRFAGLIKNKTLGVIDNRSVSLICNMFDAETIIEIEKEIELKSGKTYTQKKHSLTIKKEYSEKVFMTPIRIVEELFDAIPTLYKIYLSEYIPQNDKLECVVSFCINKDQFKSLKFDYNDQSSIIKSLKQISAIYEYQSKEFQFSEINPVDTPKGVQSIDKTMAMQASSSTTFFAGSVIDQNIDQTLVLDDKNDLDKTIMVDGNTKIKDLDQSTLMFNGAPDLRSIIDKKSNQDTPNIEQFISASGFKVISREKLSSNEVSIIAENSSPLLGGKYVIHYRLDDDKVNEDGIVSIIDVMKKSDIEKGIYITNGSFTLSAVSAAGKKKIELFDKDKLAERTN